MSIEEKPLIWVGGSKKDLCALPEEVRQFFGHAINLAQHGLQHSSAKVMRGFGGAGVLEIVENDEGGTYRAVYTVLFRDAVCVLHCFQKKSKAGIATPREDMDLIRSRLKFVELRIKEYRDGKTRQ
jgi:phage-related protein